jgi:hypothetical protein
MQEPTVAAASTMEQATTGTREHAQNRAVITAAPPPHLGPTESNANRGPDVSLDAIPCRHQPQLGPG